LADHLLHCHTSRYGGHDTLAGSCAVATDDEWLRNLVAIALRRRVLLFAAFVIVVAAADDAAAADARRASAAATHHRDEQSPEFPADEAVYEEIYGRVERQKNIGDGINVAVIVVFQRPASYGLRLNNIARGMINVNTNWHSAFDHDFGKCKPIFKTLSLTDFQEKFRRSYLCWYILPCEILKLKFTTERLLI